MDLIDPALGERNGCAWMEGRGGLGVCVVGGWGGGMISDNRGEKSLVFEGFV